MADGWIFQANPNHYDIDGALAKLDAIDWRVPQYTSQVAVNDPVVIWRSGKDAGVVGLGRVLDPPRGARPEDDDDPFVLGGQEDEDVATTRVRLSVRRVDLVSKAQVAALPTLANHQIVTAPMGTVFPLDGIELQQFLTLVHEDLPPEVRRDVGALPQPLAWDQRYKSVIPIPGPADEYLETLAQILTYVDDQQPPEDDLGRWMGETFGVSRTNQGNTIKFLQRVSLIRSSSALIELTAEGGYWLESRDDPYLLALFHSRIRYIGEMLAAIEAGVRTPKDLLDHANQVFSAGWTTRTQVDRRRYILGAVGATAASNEGLLSPTELGKRALKALTLHEPGQPQHPAPIEKGPERPDPPAQASVASDEELDEIIARLEATAHDSSDPDALERAARDAFAFLGFKAKWLGGSGKTDVLLAAELGPAEQYRVIVDTKSTSHAAVGDQQIDWITLRDHRRQHEADHACLVAPAFRGSRLQERAADQDVGLIEIPDLVSLLQQHSQAPLGLGEYRRIFQRPQGIEEVAESAEQFRRGLDLAARVIQLLDDLQGTEGALQARDLYWNLKADEEDEFEPPTKDELKALLDALATPPLRLLRSTDDGYLSLGSRGTTRRRLEVLASLLADS
ncbi:EVE domain-containing protein [Salsipaludibacter albus]|uniref:EVE domain-containing protein n=1 Tax=Salsipaludibacter albus TaxID=2849650 RepID=UPI001EE43B5C|nr:EVE domain-containing protein [Salsipaludibacter albus]MBY5162088.1 EVE domain-containing protein [Salsipaludibacter albus]